MVKIDRIAKIKFTMPNKTGNSNFSAIMHRHKDGRLEMQIGNNTFRFNNKDFISAVSFVCGVKRR